MCTLVAVLVDDEDVVVPLIKILKDDFTLHEELAELIVLNVAYAVERDSNYVLNYDNRLDIYL